ILRNARITETKTWKENKLVEHHTYRDSIVGIRVVQTDIYNELGGARQKEIVITYSDTLNAVKRGNDILLLDYTPDTAWFPSPLPRVPPDPTYADLFPYRTATRLNGKLVKYEFFNFYTGTIRPLLVIIKSDEGIVSYMQYADYVMRRKVW
ncbi:MAG TPA: hypothetical protein VK826_09560, partial [Bacteroidia bacterium]|nr:hypothetical protein [Bacteroidia bacterium]